MPKSPNDPKMAVEKLLESEPDQLFEELGLRKSAMLAEPHRAGAFDSDATFDAPFAGPLEFMGDIGRRFFERINRDVYDLVCGTDSANATERKVILESMNLGETMFATTLVGAIVSTFGIAPTLATVVAALVVRLFFKDAYTATCDVWKEHLPKVT
ncbi:MULTISPECIES: hypothetical protein [unclassified Bradyrhizobium]|uniref:hypothetical protein n=1 Tax=unclassified Bradyrhizobium TaxID=2631580 RepID=UPI002916B046|nr:MULTISPECIES: hypothetical protein [unclassified Bradyrhizobium]